MKSRNKKRLLALVLCMVVAISNSSFIFASETGQTEYPQEVQTQDEAVADDMDVAAYAADEGQAVAEEQTAAVEQVAAEPAAEPETTAENQAAQPVAEAPAAEQPTTEAPAAETPAAQASVAQEPATVSEGATTPENTNASVGEAQTPQGEENGETVTYNQKMDLKQDFTDEQENVVATVSAEIPEGAFQVEESSKITMEVTTLTDTEKTQLENLMKEKIPAEKELGQYVAYNIRFKVDGTETESLQPIKITMTGDKTQIDDVENATVFYLDPADPTVPGDKDELEEIIQRTALIKNLQEDEQSNENIDEECDLSEITLNEDGIAEKIQMEGRKSTIYGCYVSNVTNQIATLINPQVTITDDIMETGHLKATPNEEIANLEDVTYKWYKIINNGSETVVEQKKVGDNYSLADDGSWLNIAYDEGTLNSDANRTSVLYKVKAYQNGKELCESTYYSVRYWNELQNGGFETPVVSRNTTSMGTGQTPTINSNWQYSNANYLAQGGVWQTTGEKESQSIKDGKYYSDYPSAAIEIINTTLNNGKYTTDYYWKDNWGASYKGAREGNQFAELNCEAEGALYQDVLTIKGETLNYWLSHRARRPEKNSSNSRTKDTMYVVIIPTSLALNGLKNDDDPIDTQEEVEQLIQNKDKYDGVYVQSYTDTAGDWTDHTGTYTAASYLTRFFFVSGKTASNDKKVGNFLDRVGFSQKLPPANPGKYSIQLQKKVSGLSAAKFKQLKDNLQFTITSSPSVNGLQNKTIKAEDFSWTKNSDGSYTGIYNKLSGSITNQTTVTITETNLDMSNYTSTSVVSVDGATAQTGTTTSFQLKEKDSKVVTFNNSYSRIHGQIPDPEPDPTVEVPHTKTIDYLGDGKTNPDTNLTGDEYYRLYLDVTGIPDVTPKAADVIFVLDVSRSMSFPIDKNEEKTATDISKQRITKLKSAASAAVNALMTGNSMVNVGVISFHTKVESQLSVTDDQASVINYINSLNYVEQKDNDRAGGTNYQDAFEKAKEMLDSLENNGRKKYVVFVSDGEPTMYNKSNGSQGMDNDIAALNAQEAAENLTAQVGLNGFYTVMVGPSKGREFLEKTITPLPAAATNEFLDGTDEKKLNNTFSAIAGSITKQIGNVTISDQLSKYVELVADKAGKIDKDSIELKVTKRLKTEEVSKATPFTDYTWKYDSATKTVSVNFGESYFLSRDTVYTVSFNVKLTQDAYSESMNAVGDSGTDYGVNKTSSGQKGFWSNDLAKVTYSRVKDNQYTEENKEYLHPVVQPKVSHSVEKKWEGKEAQSVEVQLKAFIRDGEEQKDVTTKVLGTEKVTLSKTNEWKYKWTNLPNKYYESGSSEGKNIIYKVKETDITQEEGVHREYKVKTEESEDGLKTTITNSEQTKWEIIKKSSSENGGPLKDAEFQLKSTDNTYTAVSDEDGVLQWKGKDETIISSIDIEEGTYTLTETKAPVGYARNAETWTVDIQYKGALPTITDEKNNSLLELKDDGVYRCEFYNTPVYDLPSTGHTGIFNILMSGILLMFAGILIIYKMKGKEVLKK